MKMWAKRMNYEHLDTPAKTGLRDELVKIHEALAQNDPKSVAPARALKLLAQR